jgi:hypothetical protein
MLLDTLLVNAEVTHFPELQHRAVKLRSVTYGAITLFSDTSHHTLMKTFVANGMVLPGVDLRLPKCANYPR